MAQIFIPVKVATNEDYNLSLEFTLGVSEIDGVIVNEGDRVLVKSQSLRLQNGIYEFNSSGVLERASDFAEGSFQTASSVVFVQDGDQFADTGWVLSTNGSILVGTTEILFEKFTVNQKPTGAEIPSSIILRSEKGYPLTNTELDNNFKYLANELTLKLYSTDFNPTNIVDRINSLTALEANLNAYRVQGFVPDESPNADTLAKRDILGDLYANRFFGDLVGNADTATEADFALLSGNVTGIVGIEHGGTDANTVETARDNLDVVWLGGDTMRGKLILDAVAEVNKAPLQLIPGVPDEKQNGDIWASSSNIFYRLNNANKTVAPLESPSFTGSVTAPTPSTNSNSTAVATTAFTQSVAALLQQNIDLKANINSPSLTGTPTSTTASISDNSNRIATTAYTTSKINNVVASYYTKVETNAQIDSARQFYYTKTETDSRISTELENYYTKAQINSTFGSYSTTVQMNNAISNAISTKANTTYVDGLQDKWGTSRKFVQSTTPSNPQEGDIWFKI